MAVNEKAQQEVEQIEQNVAALANLEFSVVELGTIDAILSQTA